MLAARLGLEGEVLVVVVVAEGLGLEEEGVLLLIEEVGLEGRLLLLGRCVLLLLGWALRLRPRRYSSAGLRKMLEVAVNMSAPMPRAEDVVPVTGSQRWFSMRIGLER